MTDKFKDVIEIWSDVIVPDPPELKSINVDTKSTAFLLLDIQQQNCTPRPRCIESIPMVKELLEDSRKRKMLVVYTLTKIGKREDVREEVRPLDEELFVASGVDKFFGTNLEDILIRNNIKNVLLAGTAAQGAVLHTATGAALRNFQVIVPIDCMSSAEIYAEQYTAWHLANAPGTKGKCVLTRRSMINWTE